MHHMQYLYISIASAFRSSQSSTRLSDMAARSMVKVMMMLNV